MFLFSPFVSLFLPHRRPRGSLISFLFVRVAFNKLSLTPSLVSLVQQPLCLAPVNSPAFDNRPRRAYASFTATLFLLSSCPLILLLLLHPFAFTRAAFLSSNLHFFFQRRLSPPSSALGGEARIRRSAGTSVVRSGRIPKTRNGVQEREWELSDPSTTHVTPSCNEARASFNLVKVASCCSFAPLGEWGQFRFEL